MNWSTWREQARNYLLEGIHPAETIWAENSGLLMGFSLGKTPLSNPRIPAEFLDLGPMVAAARDDDRWSLLYRLVYRLNHENPNLLHIAVDPDVKKAKDLAKSVRRDIHKMHAFVRFKKVMIDEKETYIAWHRPEHFSVELGTPFFVRRFGDKPWSIFTPDLSAHWNLKELTFSEGMPDHEFQHRDEFDEVWKTYYKSIFNPSRINLKMMRQEMPTKYWSSMPETALIAELVREAPQRLQKMVKDQSTKITVPKNLSLEQTKQLALNCKVCPWATESTQVVFGEGNLNARLMIVGEQPGDEEDLAGRAFVGPAGKVLAQILEDLSIARESIYITNAVKHFKFTVERGKLRKHSKPTGTDMHTCKPWLEAEISAVKPKVILALGVTAATAVAGRLVNIQQERTRSDLKNYFADHILVSWHPSAILRAHNVEDREKKLHELKEDIAKALQLSKPDLVGPLVLNNLA